MVKCDKEKEGEKMTLAEFFGAVKEARFTFIEIKDFIVSLFQSVLNDDGVIDIWQFLHSAYSSYIIPISLVLISLAAAVAFYGRRISGIVKFILFFLIGFTVGVAYLSPIIPDNVNIPSWTIGLVVAVVMAVLYKYLYYVLLTVALTYSLYRIFYTGFFISLTAPYTAGKAMVSLLV